MKRVLLLSVMLCFIVAAIAQTGNQLQPVSTKFNRTQQVLAPEKTTPIPSFTQDVREPFTKKVNGRDLTFIPIGASGNAYGFYSNPRTYLWADPRINSVSFVHRMTADVLPYGNSHVAYDVSWAGGANGTWTNNIEVYVPTGPGSGYPDAAGRYPQGGIFNPPGNTDPDNAYFAYFIPTLDNTNLCGTNPWGGLGYGVNPLTSVAPPAPTQTNLVSGGDYWHLIPDAFTITQDGHAWMVDGNYPCDAGAYTYDGNVYAAHGVWDPDEEDLVYEEFLIPALGYADGINDMKIAFSPDGQTGYICIMSDAVSEPQDFNGYHPILLKTTDGGENWDDPVHVLLGGYDGIESIKNYWPDETILSIEEYSGGFIRDEVYYNMGFQVDMAVDAWGNPHITGVISLAVADGWYPYEGTMATWHVFSTDGGETFDATALYDNIFLEGALGEIAEYNRPQISSTLDGKFLFISCIDTDFEGLEDNSQPDIFCCSYDIDNEVYTDMVNVTQFTQAWLVAWEGSQSHYVFSELDGTTLTCTVPFVYTELDPTNGANPVSFWYVDGWTYQFTVEQSYLPPTNFVIENEPGTPDVMLSWSAPTRSPLGYNVYRNDLKLNEVPITDLFYNDMGLENGEYTYCVTAVYEGGNESDPVCGEQSIIISVGMEELENSFRIYPNPVKGMFNMEFNTEVQLVKILNDMGMVVYVNERVSQNRILQVNVSSFEPGIYFVQVKTAKGLATKKLTVQ